MYIFNNSKKDIHLRSFEGYAFVIPSGISAIWDKAGEHLLKNIYKVESPGGKDKYGFDNGHGLPVLTEAKEENWNNSGRHLVGVSRYKINASLIPRASLIKLALQRGVSHEKVSEFNIDQQIDKETIVDAINSLPVPDEVKYPADIEAVEIDENNDDKQI